MAKIIFITGGQRSGKAVTLSNWLLELSDNPVYVATSRVWDDDFKARIERHKTDRGACWTNFEEEKEISKLNIDNRVVVLDCITLWLTNFFSDAELNSNLALEKAKLEWNKISKKDATLIVISNEIGMGVHAESASVRSFTDIHGWINQHIAKLADEVYLMVSGLALKVK